MTNKNSKISIELSQAGKDRIFKMTVNNIKDSAAL